MKKTILFTILISLLIATPVFAAVFQSDLTVTSTSATSYDMAGVRVAMDNDYMSTNGYMLATGRDTRVILGSNTYKHMLHDDYTYFAVPIPTLSNTTYQLTTENTAADMSIVPGYNGYVTVADAAALELGNNGELNFTDLALYETGNVIFKPEAFLMDYNGATDTLKYDVFAVAANETLAPNGVGSETNIGTLFGAVTNWQANLTNDGDTSYVENGALAYQRDLYTTVDTGVGAGYINSVSISAIAKDPSGVGNASHLRNVIRTNGTTYEGAINGITGLYATYTTTYTTNPQTGDFWTWAEVDAMEIGISINGSGTGRSARCTQVYATVNYSAVALSVSAAVTEGEYDVDVVLDTVNLELYVDTVLEDSVALAGASVPDNANNWILMSNATPYLGAYKHSVAGTLIAHYEPAAMITTTTLPDREGAAQNGVFTFGTAPASVTITAGALTLINETTAEGASIPSPEYGDDFTPPSDMTKPDNELLMPNNEFYSFVAAIASLSNTDINMLWWWVASTFSIIAVAVGRKYTNNVWVGGLLGVAFSGFFVSMGGVELWIPAYIFIATAFVGVWQRTGDV